VPAEDTPSAVAATAGHALRRKSWEFPWENDGKLWKMMGKMGILTILTGKNCGHLENIGICN
jgi:hypothetical protein